MSCGSQPKKKKKKSTQSMATHGTSPQRKTPAVVEDPSALKQEVKILLNRVLSKIDDSPEKAVHILKEWISK